MWMFIGFVILLWVIVGIGDSIIRAIEETDE